MRSSSVGGADEVGALTAKLRNRTASEQNLIFVRMDIGGSLHGGTEGRA
jgi:hypothetical protein